MDQGCEACMAKISELLAERDALKAELGVARRKWGEYAEIAAAGNADNVRLRAELELVKESGGARYVKLGLENERLKAAHREYDTRFRMELVAQVTAWRRKAKQLDGYDVGMHEVRACADELELLLAKVQS